MRIHRVSYPHTGMTYEQEGGGGNATSVMEKAAQGAGDGTDSVDYWKDEAKKAFRDRDTTAKKLRELEKRAMSEEDAALFATLKAEREQAEEARKRKEGEFDSLRQQLVEKHTKEAEALKHEVATVRDRFKHTIKAAEFGKLTDYFGGDTAKTIFDPAMAMDVLGKYVSVEDVEGDPLGYRVVVKLPTGETILGDDGRPAPPTSAIKELIDALPNRDRIWRGSGKTGSGSAGGSTTAQAGPLDLSKLGPGTDFSDPKVRAALKKRTAAAGGLQIGPAWDRATGA